MYMYLYILECFLSSIILFVNWMSWFKFVCYNCGWIISLNNFISHFISIHAFTADTYLTSTDESGVQDCFVVDRDYTSAYFLISKYCHLSTFLILHTHAGWESNSFETEFCHIRSRSLMIWKWERLCRTKGQTNYSKLVTSLYWSSKVRTLQEYLLVRKT